MVANCIIANAACLGYFLCRCDFNVLPHVIVPLLGIAAFTPAWLTAAGLPVFPLVSELTAPISYAGPAVAIWIGLSLVWMLVLYLLKPQRVGDVSRVHFDE